MLVRCGKASVEVRLLLLPKFHFLPHLGRNTLQTGNPRLHSTYADEARNRDVVRVIQACSTKDFSARCLAKLQLGLQLERLQLEGI